VSAHLPALYTTNRTDNYYANRIPFHSHRHEVAYKKFNFNRHVILLPHHKSSESKKKNVNNYPSKVKNLVFILLKSTQNAKDMFPEEKEKIIQNPNLT
jgi:hypothetical protein